MTQAIDDSALVTLIERAEQANREDPVVLAAAEALKQYQDLLDYAGVSERDPEPGEAYMTCVLGQGVVKTYTLTPSHLFHIGARSQDGRFFVQIDNPGKKAVGVNIERSGHVPGSALPAICPKSTNKVDVVMTEEDS